MSKTTRVHMYIYKMADRAYCDTQELHKFLSEFFITLRRKEDNKEYEPNSLRAFFASFERHLKKKLWTLHCERRPVQANSESTSVEAKGSKTVCISNFELP